SRKHWGQRLAAEGLAPITRGEKIPRPDPLARRRLQRRHAGHLDERTGRPEVVDGVIIRRGEEEAIQEECTPVEPEVQTRLNAPRPPESERKRDLTLSEPSPDGGRRSYDPDMPRERQRREGFSAIVARNRKAQSDKRGAAMAFLGNEPLTEECAAALRADCLQELAEQ